MTALRTTHVRKPLHPRALTYCGFSTGDGLWDVEGHLVDAKDYSLERREGGLQQAGDPIHDMQLRVTVEASLKILDTKTQLFSTPLREYTSAADPMHPLIVPILVRGWSQAGNAAIGGLQDCTHRREFLFSMFAAATQKIPSHMGQQRRQKGKAPPPDSAASHYFGQCMTRRRDGPVAQRIHPHLRAPPASDHAAN